MAAQLTGRAAGRPTPRRRRRLARKAEERPNSAGLDRINSRLPVDSREVIPALAAQRDESLAALSRMLGRYSGYLGTFVREGVPAVLTERDHRLLADHFGVSERRLGIRDLWASAADNPIYRLAN